MKKDVVYSIRMSLLVRESLNRAAAKERRTVASLLDKMIFNYLEDNEYLQLTETLNDRRRYRDRRRFKRNKITLPATLTIRARGKKEILACVIINITPKGVLVSFPKKSKIKIGTEGDLPHFELSFHLPQIENIIHCQFKSIRIIEKVREIQIAAVIKESNEETLKQLKLYFD